MLCLQALVGRVEGHAASIVGRLDIVRHYVHATARLIAVLPLIMNFKGTLSRVSGEAWWKADARAKRDGMRHGERAQPGALGLRKAALGTDEHGPWHTPETVRQALRGTRKRLVAEHQPPPLRVERSPP